jgi:hypothetical protein
MRCSHCTSGQNSASGNEGGVHPVSFIHMLKSPKAILTALFVLTTSVLSVAVLPSFPAFLILTIQCVEGSAGFSPAYLFDLG